MTLIPFRVVETCGVVRHRCGCIDVPDREHPGRVRASVVCKQHRRDGRFSA